MAICSTCRIQERRGVNKGGAGFCDDAGSFKIGIYTTYLGEYLALQDEEAVVVQVDAAALEQLRHLETWTIGGFD
jgi:hypothetical protein